MLTTFKKNKYLGYLGKKEAAQDFMQIESEGSVLLNKKREVNN
jgi:hypothetical protein